ncbi:MAG: hypothetical protein AAGA18_06110 [Verrucomicrobiota bacterium]
MEGVKPSVLTSYFRLAGQTRDQIPTSEAKLLPHHSPWADILAQEKKLAQEYFLARGVSDVQGYAVTDALPKPGPHFAKTLPESKEPKSLNKPMESKPLVQSETQSRAYTTADEVKASAMQEKSLKALPAKLDREVSLIANKVQDPQRPVLVSWSEEVPARAETTAKEAQALPVIEQAQPVDVKSLNNKAGNFPVEDIAKQKGFLRKADVDFDENNKVWTAKWWKPKMFHFGMLLYPALKDQLESGASYSFVSRGVESTITKAQDELFLERGQNRIKIGSQELYGLLRGKISVGGYDLQLDRRGNLIMQAEGPEALVMASIKR